MDAVDDKSHRAGSPPPPNGQWADTPPRLHLEMKHASVQGPSRPDPCQTSAHPHLTTPNFTDDTKLHLDINPFYLSLQVNITPAQGEISVGESKFFLCEVVGGAKEIDWFTPTGEKIEPNRPDITVVRLVETSSTLTIYNANINNAGTYKCVASSGDEEAEATVSVKIYQKITFKNAPTPQEFNEGGNANIICDVVSLPPPTVIWKYKNARIQLEKDVRFRILSNNHLQIRGIRKTDEGLYTCEGRIMTRGEIDFRVINVVVNVLPTIRIPQAEVNATADMGNSAVLACDADGFPEPTVTWKRNNVPLKKGDKYSFNEDGSEMTIMDVKKLDEGDYTCIAENKAGQREEELSLKVFVRPQITFLENASTTEMEEQIRLTCEATGDPTPSITWSFGTRTFTEGEQEHLKRIYQASWTRPEQHKSQDGNVLVRSDARVSSLTLKMAQYTDAGQYLCAARNAIGETSQHMYLEVLYAPKIQGPVTVYTWEGNAANLSCEVLAHPSDVSIFWLRDGIQLPSANTTNIKIFNTPSASYLQINPESQNDFGSYNCTASNEIGTESKEFLLIQADVPSAPSIIQVEPYSSTAQVSYEEPEASGGVPVLRYRAEWRTVGRGNWMQRIYEVREEGVNAITISGLKPETDYEVKMYAINGKGEGEGSLPAVFKTRPVRYSYENGIFHFFTVETEGEPNAPKLEGALQSEGNAFKVNWIRQDDGGSPITHYLVRYKAKKAMDWKPEIRLPSASDYVQLHGLDWDTEYEVYVVAENQQGKSQPGTLTFRTSSEPAVTPGTVGEGTGLNTGFIVGILIVVFVLLLVAVDVTCYFLNKCGLLMCIAVNICGKAGPGSKGKDIEAGKAAYLKGESKDPIVEMKTDEEHTANHDGVGHPEPNETTPLTEPEQAADAATTVVDLPLSVATNSDPVTETFEISQSSPASETTTLTSSITAPAPDTRPVSVPDSSTPKPSSQPPDSSSQPSSDLMPKEAPLVDLSDSVPAEAKVTVVNPSETQSKPEAVAPAASAPSSAAPIADLLQDKQIPAPAKAEASAASVQSPAQPVTEPTPPKSNTPTPSVNHKPQIDAETPQASDTDLSKDVSEAVGTAASSGPSAAAQNEKTAAEEKSKSGDAELKKVQSEAAPNEVVQTNSTESKA
ncbi:neural cell adhesion molecule 1b [Chanos chanos]|uniref:Neural cell adhesion molecule 1b n=1 Tax=Chanos chanos TaxID=29144 RepID=A0A6J2VS02_CHACN|nr:neural cell adhesion molecule 1-like [Chanos chanos]